MSVTKTSPRIDWQYPEPRGWFDRFIGPGVTRAELWLQFGVASLVAVALPMAAVVDNRGWTWWQLLLIAVIAFDLMGGVVTNATSTAKRWYHRPGQSFNQHMGFILLHLLQPLVVVLAFDPGNWLFVGGSFGYLVLASLLILRAPLYLQRPLALSLLVGGIFLSLYVLPVPLYFEWFLPVYYVKLLVSHLLYEEPYRPAEQA